MKLPELEMKTEEDIALLSDLIEDLLVVAAVKSGDSREKDVVGRAMDSVMDIWENIDEMNAYVLGVKSGINVPSLGMSMAEADVLLTGLQQREVFLANLSHNLKRNAAFGGDPSMSPETYDEDASLGDDDTRPQLLCPHCSEERGVPIDPVIIDDMVAEIRERIIEVKTAIERTAWQTSVMWYDDDDDDDNDDDVDDASFAVIDPECPICTSNDRVDIEQFWMAHNNDVDATLEAGIQKGVLPENLNPQQTLVHFSDHFNYADHGIDGAEI